MEERLKAAKREADRAYQQHRASRLRQLGLCVRCGKLNSDARYANCPECRALARRRMKARALRDALQTIRPSNSALPLGEGQRQLCSRCAWARYEAGVIYCPLAAGTCAKRGTMLRGVSSGLGVEPPATTETT